MNSIYENNFLYFDEGPHKYTDSLGNEYLSVTTNIENYCPKFDKKYWLRKKLKNVVLVNVNLKLNGKE